MTAASEQRRRRAPSTVGTATARGPRRCRPRCSAARSPNRRADRRRIRRRAGCGRRRATTATSASTAWNTTRTDTSTNARRRTARLARRSGLAAFAPARRPTRASATAPIDATASTVISPRVSKPRKSTRITLTTLRPWPSGSDRATISSDTGGAMRCPAATMANTKTIAPTRTGDRRARTRAPPRRRLTLEPLGQAAQHEHEHDRRQRLDRDLGEREVGRALTARTGRPSRSRRRRGTRRRRTAGERWPRQVPRRQAQSRRACRGARELGPTGPRRGKERARRKHARGGKNDAHVDR